MIKQIAQDIVTKRKKKIEQLRAELDRFDANHPDDQVRVQRLITKNIKQLAEDERNLELVLKVVK